MEKLNFIYCYHSILYSFCFYMFFTYIFNAFLLSKWNTKTPFLENGTKFCSNLIKYIFVWDVSSLEKFFDVHLFYEKLIPTLQKNILSLWSNLVANFLLFLKHWLFPELKKREKYYLMNIFFWSVPILREKTRFLFLWSNHLFWSFFTISQIEMFFFNMFSLQNLEKI